MSVDQQGRIQVVGSQPFQDEYLPILEDIRRKLSPLNVPLIHSVYVYGSVATRRAVPWQSDLDLSLILHSPPSEYDSHCIEKIRQEIEAAHPIISKVDFDIGVISALASGDASMAWQYWLKHHCRCLVGVNLAEDILPFSPSRTLALAVNGDFQQALEKYLLALAVDQTQAANNRLAKEASRKLIRSTNVLRHDKDSDWPETLEEHVIRFEARFPTHRDELRYFFEQAQWPDAAPECFSRRLRTFVGWMARTVHDDAK